MKPPKKIVLFGDGLIDASAELSQHGFFLQLTEMYRMRADFILRGFSGYNTSEIKPLASEISELHPRLVFLAFGNSDSVLESQIQHIPLDTFEANLDKMAEDVALHGAWPVLITPIAPNEHRIRSRNLRTTREYALAVRRVADSMQAEVVDLFHAMQLCDDWEKELLLKDGISLSAKGNTLATRLCAKVIDNLFPGDALGRLRPGPAAPTE